MSNPMYQAFVLIPEEHTPTLEVVEAAIRRTFAPRGDEVQLARNDAAVEVAFSGYHFRVALLADASSAAESREIARRSAVGRPDQDVIARCPARFEVWAAAFDDALVAYADYHRLIDVLEELYPGAIPFEPQTGTFLRDGETLASAKRTKRIPRKKPAAAKEKKPVAAKKKPVAKKKKPRKPTWPRA